MSIVGQCGSGARKLLEIGESLLQTMVHIMDSSNSSARVDGFRLAQCLAVIFIFLMILEANLCFND